MQQNAKTWHNCMIFKENICCEFSQQISTLLNTANHLIVLLIMNIISRYKPTNRNIKMAKSQKKQDSGKQKVKPNFGGGGGIKLPRKPAKPR